MARADPPGSPCLALRIEQWADWCGYYAGTSAGKLIVSSTSNPGLVWPAQAEDKKFNGRVLVELFLHLNGISLFQLKVRHSVRCG